MTPEILAKLTSLIAPGLVSGLGVATLCEAHASAAIGGVYAPAGSGRTPWGFKSFLPALLYGTSPTVARGKGATVPTVLVSTSSSDRNVVDHPVPKPLDWMLWSVRLASDPGETVLDPFAGSGTTGVACLRLGRRFIGIEKAPRYFALACERLRAEEQGSTLQAARAGQLSLLGRCGSTAGASKVTK